MTKIEEIKELIDRYAAEQVRLAFIDLDKLLYDDAGSLNSRARIAEKMKLVMTLTLPELRSPPKGFLEVGHSNGEVIINHPDLRPDANGVGHIVFSPEEARGLADLLRKNAEEAERKT